MFLRIKTRKKDGKEHRYRSVVEIRRVAGGRVVQRHVSEGLLPDESIVRLKLKSMHLHRPRQWGACWLALSLWQTLDLDVFWAERLPPSRKGTRWDLVV